MVSRNEETLVSDSAEPVTQSGGEHVLIEMWDYAERSQQLLNMRPELTKKYPDQWVALTETRTLVVADSIEGIVAKIKEIGERPEFAAAKYLNTRPRRMIPG